MDVKLHRALALCGTDIEGAVNRVNNSEELYINCLKMFLDDPTLSELNNALEQRSWDDAFTAAHALKGLAGNMGFVPLMHASSQLVIMIRSGKTGELKKYTAQVNSEYRIITKAIRSIFTQSEYEGRTK